MGSRTVRRVVRLSVEFPVNRDRCGELKLLDEQGRTVCGPFPVAGRASDVTARNNGNPTRNPLFRYGDTPVGSYRVQSLLKSGPRTNFPASQWGPNGVVVIEPVDGEAAIAEANGRFRFLITGGDLSNDGGLVSTAGGLRLSNRHMRALVRALSRDTVLECDVMEAKRTAGGSRVSIQAGEALEDPVRLPNRAIPSRSMSREAIRSGAGAVALGVAVSFVTLQSPAPANAATSLVAMRADSPKGDTQGIQPPKARPAGNYVRLAYGESVSVIDKDQQAVAAAQARVDAATAARDAATTDQARQQAQIDISNATQELGRAKGQLRIDQSQGN